MPYSIAKTLQISIATFAIFPLLFLNFNIQSARAEAPMKSTTEVGTNFLQSDSNEESPPEDPQTEATNSSREKSQEYLTTGWEAEKSGNKEDALKNYYKAIETDRTWGGGYLMVAHLVGNTETGIKYAKTALERFEAEGERQGAEAALELLKEFNAQN